jgi:hypothetical protein
MGDNVHFRLTRKRTSRDAAENAAAINWYAHGRGITDRTAVQSRGAQARKRLDQHRIESGDGS